MDEVMKKTGAASNGMKRPSAMRPPINCELGPSSHAFRLPMTWRIGVFAAICAIFIPEWSFGQPAAPKVPKEIAVPPGHKLLFKVEAKGVQIYKAVAGKAGLPEWILEAPLADLFDNKGGKAGHHYDSPPAWEAADGSKVIKSGDAKSAPAPHPKKDIPWLLVKVKTDQGKAGMFSSVVYIQRLQTEGGIAPS